MDKLKPCPFCGDNQQLNYVELSNGLHYIECERCGAAPHRLGAWNRETAVKYWNSVNRWIPCSERLPYGGRVLATTKQGYVVDVIFVAKGSQWFRNGEHFPTDAVIAWMPMPDAYEPPEGGADHA